MKSVNTISGIDIIGDIPWGTHFCQFYKTKEDLMEIIIPYLKAGLENNEFCLWILPDQLDEEKVKEALQVGVPGIDTYLENGQIEIVTYTYWYVEEGALDPQMALNHLIEKSNQALASGYDGLRYSGNDFCGHGKILDSVIGKYPVIALCTYFLDKLINVTASFDIVANHQFALVKREGKWETVESHPQKNIVNFQQTEKVLQESEDRYKAVFDSSLDGIFITNPDGIILAANSAACQMFGMTEEEFIQAGRNGIVDASDQRLESTLDERARTGRFSGELNFRRKDGTIFPAEISNSFFKDNHGVVRTAIIIRDITKRREAEFKLKETLANLDRLVKERTAELEEAYNLLKESEKGLEEAQKMVHLGSWNWNLITGEVYWSDELFHIFGLNPRKFGLSYDQVLNYIHPNDRDYVDNTVKAAASSNGGRYSIDHRIVLDDGSERVVHAQGEFIFDKINDPIRMRGILQDITERKEAEEKLRESEEKYRNIVETSNEGIYFVNDEGKVTFANKMMDTSGYSLDEIIGRPVWNFVPEESLPVAKKEFEKRRKGISGSYELKLIRKDGSYIWAHITAKPFFNKKGKFKGYLAMMADITERKEAEKKLQESEEKYRNIVETANEGIVTTDNEEIVTFVNNKVIDMLGYAPEEIIGRPIWDFISEDYRPIVKMHLKKRRHRISESYELKLMRKNGSSIWVFLNAKSLFDKNGKYLGAMSMLTDITQRKEAEEALAKIEQIRIKEIHHRIKNNLQVISSLLDLQAEKFPNVEICESPEVIEAFNESKNRVISMALIHEELYNGNKIDALDFASYLDKLSTDIFGSYNLVNNKINLKLNLEQVYLNMDTAIPLGIIVNELVSNSFKHAFPDGRKGEIHINLHKAENSTANNEISNSDEDCIEKSGFDYILEVADSGIGIPKEMDTENSNSLGLQLVNILVEQIEGCLEVKSDKGTEFTIWFNNLEA